MKKKEYKVPSAKVVNLNSISIICTSDSLGLGDPDGDDTPGAEDDGYIHVESKGQYIFDCME